MELFYSDGSTVSVADWNWLNNAADLPFKFKLPGGAGWPAVNAVTLPHKFVLASRKRAVDETTGCMQGRVTPMMDVVRRIAEAPHADTVLATDCGATTFAVAKQGSTPGCSCCSKCGAYIRC